MTRAKLHHFEAMIDRQINQNPLSRMIVSKQEYFNKLTPGFGELDTFNSNE